MNAALIPCPFCGGYGCTMCVDGNMKITRCPWADILPETVEFVGLAKLYEKGLPPSAGGAVDQPASFIDAYQLYQRVKSHFSRRDDPAE